MRIAEVEGDSGIAVKEGVLKEGAPGSRPHDGNAKFTSAQRQWLAANLVPERLARVEEQEVAGILQLYLEKIPNGISLQVRLELEEIAKRYAECQHGLRTERMVCLEEALLSADELPESGRDGYTETMVFTVPEGSVWGEGGQNTMTFFLSFERFPRFRAFQASANDYKMRFRLALPGGK